MATIPMKCPVCDGRGKVCEGWYDGMQFSPSVRPDWATEPCRSCNNGIIWGSGVTVEELDIPVEYKPIYETTTVPPFEMTCFTAG